MNEQQLADAIKVLKANDQPQPTVLVAPNEALKADWEQRYPGVEIVLASAISELRGGV